MTCKTRWFRGATAPGALISSLRQHREVPMRKKHCARGLIGSFAIAAGLLFPIDADAQEVVDFRTFDSGAGTEVPSLTDGSLIVTGSSNLFLHLPLGLGIVGGGPFGGNHGTIDGGETVTFSFARPASNIVINDACFLNDLNGGGVLVRLSALDASGNPVPDVSSTLSDGESVSTSLQSSTLVRYPA